MILCSNCGLELDHHADFCPQCGAIIEKQEEINQADIQNANKKQKRIVVEGLHDKNEYGEESERINKIKKSGWSFTDENSNISSSKSVEKSLLKEEKTEVKPEIVKKAVEKEVKQVFTREKKDNHQNVKKNLLLGTPKKATENIEDNTKQEITKDNESENALAVIDKRVSPKNLLMASSNKKAQLFNQDEPIKTSGEGRKKKDKKESLLSSFKNKKPVNTESKTKENKDEVIITEVSTKELLADYSDEVMIGSKDDINKILEQEAEREKLLEKAKESSESKKSGRKKKGLLASVISGFADEKEDEKIKAEITKSKQEHQNSQLGPLITGFEGRKKKKNNNELAINEGRQDKISQLKTDEQEYDNYYEFVMPLDEMKYERRSSFKAHLIGIALIIIASIAIAVFIGSTGIGNGVR